MTRTSILRSLFAVTLFLVAAIAVLGSPRPACATGCDCIHPNGPALCNAWFLQDPGEMVVVFCLPDGSGYSLSEARGHDGTIHDATIVVRVEYDSGDPCPDAPAEDVWLDVMPDTDGNFIACPNGTIADGPTDENGITTISGAFAAGGHSSPYDDIMQVRVMGNALVIPGFDVHVNSADINGDLMVDLTDIGLFAQDFYGDYRFRSDFVWDQVLNLSDIGRLANAIGASCLPE